MRPAILGAFLTSTLCAQHPESPAVDPDPAVQTGEATKDKLPEALYLGASFPSARVCIVVGGRLETDPGIVMRTEDDGATWFAACIPAATARLYDVQFPTEKIGFACGLQGLILRTRDGGRSWGVVLTPFGKNWFSAVHFVDEQRGFVVGSKDGPLLARTEDAGKTWQQITVPGATAEGNLRDVLFVDEQLGFACGSDGLLLRSEDGGSSWQQIESGSQAWLRHFWFVDRQNGFLVGGDGALLATTDGGKSWLVRGRFGGKGNGVAFADQDRGLVVTMAGEIWRTADGGRSFVLQQQAQGALTIVVPRGKDGWWLFGENVPPIRLPAGISDR